MRLATEVHIMSTMTGGPAFPAPEAATTLFGEGQADRFMGMELRDYFAAKALQGLISTSGAPCLLGMGGCENETATTAYKLADAMLTARVKP